MAQSHFIKDHDNEIYRFECFKIAFSRTATQKSASALVMHIGGFILKTYKT